MTRGRPSAGDDPRSGPGRRPSGYSHATMQAHPTRLVSLLVAAIALFAASSPGSAMIGGRDDADSPEANAAAQVAGGTGVLITPNIVLTAAHNVTGDRRGTPDGDALPQCADWQVPGRWYPLVRTTSDIDVSFGAARADRYTVQATHYTLPGCADMMMLRLAEPIPPRVASPVKVFVAAGAKSGAKDSDHFAGETLTMSGWGFTGRGTLPSVRQTAEAGYDGHDDELMRTSSPDSAVLEVGDSGGPLLWTHKGVRYVIGVAQGPSGTQGRYTPTFRRPVNGKPSVEQWFLTHVPEATQCPDPATAPAGTVPLVTWWSRDRKDNMTTSMVEWAGCYGAVRGPDYTYSNTAGFVFDPGSPQPVGTVPLYRWYNGSDRRDNWTTTQHESAGRARADLSPEYRFSRLEGYVFSPSQPRPPGTVPLYRWYDSDRKDNWTTSQHADAGAAGRGLSPAYGPPVLQGYVYPATP